MKRPLFRSLYFQVLVAITLGSVFGFFFPEYGEAMKPLGDGFIKLVKMLIAPIVFTTLAVGIAQMGDAKHVGRIGLLSLVYFEVASLVALLIGLAVVTIVQPGSGVNFNPADADMSLVAAYTSGAQASAGIIEFLLNVIPDAAIGAIARGDVLQVLVFAVLFGLALLKLGTRAASLVGVLSQASDTLFLCVGLIMRLAPIGAFGAMAFTVGRYGIGTLVSLGTLIASVYAACGIFIVLLCAIILALGLKPLKFLRYISEEILIVLGTASSESVLPRLMAKMERLGCSKPVVGLVVPTGYSFNLDGTAIYMTMAALFVAQATGVHLSMGQQLGLLLLLMLTSKGAAAVTGSGFVTLAATLVAFPSIPLAGLTLLLGVDRFMSEARAITNLIGNAVATIAIAWWDGALDMDRARRILDGENVANAEPAPAAEFVIGPMTAEPRQAGAPV